MGKKVYISTHARFSCKIVPATKEEIMGKVVTKSPGRTVNFNGGVYATDDKEEQALIEKCPAFGTDIFDAASGKTPGSLKVKVETGAIAPTPYDPAEVAKIKEREEANQQTAKELNEKSQAMAKREAELKEREAALKKAEESMGSPDAPAPKKRGRKKGK